MTGQILQPAVGEFVGNTQILFRQAAHNGGGGTVAPPCVAIEGQALAVSVKDAIFAVDE